MSSLVAGLAQGNGVVLPILRAAPPGLAWVQGHQVVHLKGAASAVVTGVLGSLQGYPAGVLPEQRMQDMNPVLEATIVGAVLSPALRQGTFTP